MLERVPPEESGIWLVMVSRVVEKSVAYALAQLWSVLEWLDKEGLVRGHRAIQFWSDCGSSYRGYRWLGTWANDVLDVYRRRGEAVGIRQSFINYGSDSHMKFECDGKFAELNERKRQSAFSKVIISVEGIVDGLAEKGSEVKLPHSPEEHFFVYLPSCSKAHTRSTVLSRQSLTCSIKGSYSWSFTLNDLWRVRLVGNDGVSLTSVDVRALRLLSVQGVADGRVTPKIRLPEAVDEPDEDDALVGEDHIVLSHADLLVNSKEWNGWRLSYRTSEPELHSEQQTVAKLRRRQSMLGANAIGHIPPGVRHQSAAKLQAACERERSRKREKKRAWTAALA